MTDKREKVRVAVIAGMEHHEATERNPRMQKGKIKTFDSVSAICDYLYEWEFCMDKTGAKDAQEEGKDLSKIAIASRNTVRSVIEDLLKEGVIQRNEDLFVLREDFSFERQKFPVLQIANKITVEMLPPEDIMFLSAPPQYAPAITDYINAVFYKKDITATMVGDLIMCMSVYPKEAYDEGFTPNPEHSERFFVQLTGALSDFDLGFRDFKYGDEYYLAYGQRHDPTLGRMVDELCRNLATIEGREFNKHTYEKCKYFMYMVMDKKAVPLSFMSDLKRDDPVLYDRLDEFYRAIIEQEASMQE